MRLGPRVEMGILGLGVPLHQRDECVDRGRADALELDLDAELVEGATDLLVIGTKPLDEGSAVSVVRGVGIEQIALLGREMLTHRPGEPTPRVVEVAPVTRARAAADVGEAGVELEVVGAEVVGRTWPGRGR